MTDPTGTAIRMQSAPTFGEVATYFGCIEMPPDENPGPRFVHFNPPLGVLPGETIHEAHARQPWVALAVLPEPLVPPGPVEPPAAIQERPDSDLSPQLIKSLAPLVFDHVMRHGFAEVPWNPATWRDGKPGVAPQPAGA